MQDDLFEVKVILVTRGEVLAFGEVLLLADDG